MSDIETVERRRIGCMTITEANDLFVLRFPYSEAILTSIRTIEGAKWDKEGRYWTVPTDNSEALEQTLEELRPALEDLEAERQATFAERREEARAELDADPIESASTKNVELSMIEEHSRIAVKFGYSEKGVALVKEIRGARWDREAKCWTVPADQHKELRERVASISRSVGQAQSKNAKGKSGGKRRSDDE